MVVVVVVVFLDVLDAGAAADAAGVTDVVAAALVLGVMFVVSCGCVFVTSSAPAAATEAMGSLTIAAAVDDVDSLVV